jgi:hypothetical protein
MTAIIPRNIGIPKNQHITKVQAAVALPLVAPQFNCGANGLLR